MTAHRAPVPRQPRQIRTWRVLAGHLWNACDRQATRALWETALLHYGSTWECGLFNGNSNAIPFVLAPGIMIAVDAKAKGNDPCKVCKDRRGRWFVSVFAGGRLLSWFVGPGEYGPCSPCLLKFLGPGEAEKRVMVQVLAGVSVPS